MRRVLRVVALSLGVAGIIGTTTPPASAEGVVTVVFAGSAHIRTGNALGFWCTANKSLWPITPQTTPGTPKCPVPPFTVNPNPNKKSPLVTVQGNTSSGTFTNAIGQCVYAKVVADKPNKPDGPATGTCSIGATFTVTGYCGLSQGSGTATLTSNDTYTINFALTSVGTVLSLRGNYRRDLGPVEGDVVAEISAQPDPVSTLPPELGGGGQSCRTKTLRNFAIEGWAALVHPKVLP